jgi:hypothetical protein
VCSHDALDPEDARQVAEGKCLASAAKLGGVRVTLRQKTVQSLTGSDSSEIAEVEPMTREVKCEWTERFLEQVGQGYRVWLRCRVSNADVTKAARSAQSKGGETTESQPSKGEVRLPYKRGILVVTTVPQADRITVGGMNGERVVEVTSNVTRLELKEGDEWVSARKQKYREKREKLRDWKHGDSLSVTLWLNEEL